MKKIKLIVNPMAGNGAGAYCVPIVKNIFKHYKTDVFKTKKKRDAIEEAKKSSNKYDIIIAAGGDGTINEVINGMAYSESKLGIIPIGTGNVFAVELNISLNIIKACNLIKKEKTKEFDLGKVNNTYFLSCSGIGFDAHVLEDMPVLIKKIFGVVAYPLTAFKKLMKYDPCEMDVIIDDKLKKKSYFTVVSNIKNYGRIFEFSPKADPSDGLLDICIFDDKLNFRKILAYMLKVLQKKHLNHAKISHFKAKKIVITSKEKIMVHADAEIIGTTPVKITIAPKAISIIVP